MVCDGEARQVIIRKGDKTVPIPLPPPQQQDLAEFLRRAIREFGLEGGEVVSCFAGQEQGDAEWIAVMEAIKAVSQEQGKMVSVTKMEPGRRIRQVSATIPITSGYLRAIAKIAFHYFLRLSPNCVRRRRIS